MTRRVTHQPAVKRTAGVASSRPHAPIKGPQTPIGQPGWIQAGSRARPPVHPAPASDAVLSKAVAGFAGPPPLALGAHGARVVQLQQSLAALGYPLEADGKFGEKTLTALKDFAHNNKLPPPTGGAVTPALASALAAKLDRGAVAAAVGRVGNTLLAADPYFFANAEEAYRKAMAEPDPQKRAALVDAWLDMISALAERHAARLDALQPDWRSDFALVGDHLRQAAAAPQSLGSELNFVHDQFDQVANRRFVSNIGIIADALEKQDPARAKAFLALLDQMESMDPNDAKPVAAFNNFFKTGPGHQGQLPPEAKQALAEIDGTLLNAGRLQSTRPIANYMEQTYVRHTLDSIQPDAKNPQQVQMTNDLRARLGKLESAADAKPGQTLTGAMLQEVVPSLPPARAAELATALDGAMKKANITTPRERAAFVAQCAHESGGFKWFRELGNDSYFTKYDNRKDLGNRGPPDGVTFKGRGPLQITGRANYTAFSQWYTGSDDLVQHPEKLETPEYGFAAAAWFWSTHGLNRPAQANDFGAVTRAINGGMNGEQDRLALYTRALGAFAEG